MSTLCVLTAFLACKAVLVRACTIFTTVIQQGVDYAFPHILGQKLEYYKDIFSLLLSGCVCTPVDSHVLSVPGGSLLYCVVCPVPAIHGCDCRTAQDTHNNGTELDDHCCASSYI